MFPNDYVMRQIELLVWGLARIMGFKQENRLEEALNLTQATLRKFFGLTDQAVEELTWHNLMVVASLGGLPDYERCALLAQLIAENADLRQMQGAEESALYLKALCIYLAVADASELLQTAEHDSRIKDLMAHVTLDCLPDELLGPVFHYHWRTGRYACAEDALYDMLEAGLPGSGEEGVDFYHALLEKSDGELDCGGLPRKEVLEGLDNLIKRVGQ